MSKHRRGVVLLVDALQSKLACEQRVATGRVDKKSGRPLGRCAVIVQRHNARTLIAIKRDIGHASALQHLRAEAPAVVKQQFVELATPDLITVADAQIRILGKSKRRGAALCASETSSAPGL